MRLLIDVAGKSNELPQSLFLAGVDIGAGRDPHSYGSFADVFCGSYQGQTVAVKRLRIDERGLARDNAHRVCSQSSSALLSLIREQIDLLQGGAAVAAA
jgi:hypothetical protein